MIYHRKALIHFPYEMSTMSLAEQYSAGVSDVCTHRQRQTD
jgi:hypothetical protein